MKVFFPSVLGIFLLYCIRFVYIRLALMSVILFIYHMGCEIAFVVTICRAGDYVVFYQILELGKQGNLREVKGTTNYVVFILPFFCQANYFLFSCLLIFYFLQNFNGYCIPRIN